LYHDELIEQWLGELEEECDDEKPGLAHDEMVDKSIGKNESMYVIILLHSSFLQHIQQTFKPTYRISTFQTTTSSCQGLTWHNQ